MELFLKTENGLQKIDESIIEKYNLVQLKKLILCFLDKRSAVV